QLNLQNPAVTFRRTPGVIKVKLSLLLLTGCGISAEFLPHVFDRFSQADSSSTRKKGGMGLGLALVRHLSELHGGAVQAASDGPDRGATFTVRLPAAREPEHACAPLEPRLLHSTILSGLKVLVVDDDLDVCDLLKIVLNQCGAQTSCVTSAKEALVWLEHKRP